MKLPIDGMKVEPLGFPLMEGAYVAFLLWATGQEDIVKHFKNETGIDLSKIVARSPLDAMIDKATGFDKDIVCKFADFVTVNYWGIKE